MNVTDVNLYGNIFLKYKTYPEFIAATYLLKICPPILIILGTIGNILSIAVLRRPKIRKSVCSIYFIMLSVSDLFVLYTGLLRQWIIQTFQIDIRTVSSTGCKIHTWLVYFFLDLSSWILIAVTIERVLLVWIPRKAKFRCTRTVAKLVLFIIGITMLCINSHMLYGYNVITTTLNQTNDAIKTCSFISNSYKRFWYYVWPFIDLTIFCGIPFGCLLVGNILIFIKVFLSRRSVQRHGVGTSLRKSHQEFSSMSIMLIAVNTMFLLCNTPISVYMIGYDTWIKNAHGRKFVIIEFLIWSVVNILMYFNNSFNFLLYTLSGSRFRKELKAMLMSRHRKLFQDKSEKRLDFCLSQHVQCWS